MKIYLKKNFGINTKTSDPKIREYFILKYAPLVKYVAGKVGIGMPTNVEFDDLVGYGVFGLLDAIEKYDLDKNVKLIPTPLIE